MRYGANFVEASNSGWAERQLADGRRRVTDPFIAIVCSSNKPVRLRELVDNLEKTCRHADDVELLVKLDSDQPEMVALIEELTARSALRITARFGPRYDGYFSLHEGYEVLFRAVSPGTYFVLLVNDELRFDTVGWDEILKSYTGFFPDDIFQLRMTRHKLRGYADLFSAINQPENYPVMTRKYLILAEGFGHFRGPDSWHGGIAYLLGQCFDKFRSVPVHDISVAWAEEVVELSERDRLVLTERNFEDYEIMCSLPTQRTLMRAALRLHLGIDAEARGIKRYTFEDDPKRCVVRLVDEAGVICARGCYKVSSLYWVFDRYVVRMLIPFLRTRDLKRPFYHFLMPSWGAFSYLIRWWLRWKHVRREFTSVRQSRGLLSALRQASNTPLWRLKF